MFTSVRLVVFKTYICNSVCLMLELCSYTPFGLLCSLLYSVLSVPRCHVNKPRLNQSPRGFFSVDFSETGLCSWISRIIAPTVGDTWQLCGLEIDPGKQIIIIKMMLIGVEENFTLEETELIECTHDIQRLHTFVDFVGTFIIQVRFPSFICSDRHYHLVVGCVIPSSLSSSSFCCHYQLVVIIVALSILSPPPPPSSIFMIIVG